MANEDPENSETDTKQAPPLSPVATALFIGFLVGILVYSAAVNSLGILSLIPLYLIYRLVKGSGNKDE